jgi:hypothetical protein
VTIERHESERLSGRLLEQLKMIKIAFGKRKGPEAETTGSKNYQEVNLTLWSDP